LSNLKLYEYGGILLFCRHGFGKHLSDDVVCEMADKDPEVSRADVVCFGHDHKARVFTDGKRVFMNPGSLMKIYGERPSFGIIDTNEHACELKQIDSEGRLIVMKVIPLN
jgi:predicted phosphodiesterase